MIWFAAWSWAYRSRTMASSGTQTSGRSARALRRTSIMSQSGAFGPPSGRASRPAGPWSIQDVAPPAFSPRADGQAGEVGVDGDGRRPGVRLEELAGGSTIARDEADSMATTVIIARRARR